MLFLTLNYNYSCCSWMFKCTISQRSRTIFFLLRCQITVIHLNSCRERLTVEWYFWLISDFLKKSSKTWIQCICMIHKNISVFSFNKSLNDFYIFCCFYYFTVWNVYGLTNFFPHRNMSCMHHCTTQPQQSPCAKRKFSFMCNYNELNNNENISIPVAGAVIAGGQCLWQSNTIPK